MAWSARRHLADLVEHDRAALGELELADACRAGAGERAALVAEQLAFEQVGRQRRAVDLHERLGPPRRPPVQLARDHFLADAALAAQQHADVAVGHALDHGQHGLHRGAGAPRHLRALRIFGGLRAEPRHFGAQRLAFERVADGRFERRFADAVGVAGLQDVVGRAQPDRFDDRLRRLPARQHDDLGRGLRLPDRPQCLDSVQVRHQDVEQDDIGRRAGSKALEQRRAAVEHLDSVALSSQQRA